MESDENPALSEPQHEKGEDNLGLDDSVSRRIKAMVKELVDKGKGSERQILLSVKKNIEKMGVGTNKDDNQDGQQQPQNQGPEDLMAPQTPQQPQAPQPQQGMPPIRTS